MDQIRSLYVLLYVVLTGISVSNCLVVDYVIVEETAVGTIVGNLKTSAGITESSNAETDSTVYQFSFLEDNHSEFAIDEHTGELRVASRIDADTVCLVDEEQCVISLDVVIKPIEVFRIIKVRVHVLDINDHTPTFPTSSIDLSCSESSPLGTTFHLPVAQDNDRANNTIQTYTLEPPSDAFHVSLSQSMDGTSELKLTLVAQLDREVKDLYHLTVVAADGGDPQQQGELRINIRVEDENDNKPSFPNTTLTVYIEENSDYNSQLAKITAEDPDEGLNGEVRYYLSPRTYQAYHQLFYIDNTTGIVYAKQPLDHEQAARYLLAITASDNGTPPRASQMTLIVDVIDLNDNSPVINMNTLTSGETAQVSEHADQGTFIAFVSVSDPDSGRNGLVTCDLNGQGFALQAVYPGQYKIITNMELDRERDSFYKISLNCFDSGEVIQMSSVSLTVLVMDVNDHDPVFTENKYYARVEENNQVADSIVNVSAVDLDSGNNGEVRYNFALGDEVGARLLNINPMTGEITAKAIFDYETIKKLKVSVVAYDLGETPHSATVAVHISVVDQNDEPPRFAQQHYDYYVRENQQEGEFVGHLVAIDADAPPYNRFEFVLLDLTEIVRQNSSEDLEASFVIDKRNGRITTAVEFDREELSEYSLEVLAINSADPPMTSTAAITVHIQDENDNTPVLLFPTDYNSTVYVPSEPKVGVALARIEATDADVGRNAELRYHLDQPEQLSSLEFFDLDEETGVLTVTERGMNIEGMQYSLNIVVKDQGITARHTKGVLNIVVDDDLAVYSTLNGWDDKRFFNDRFTILVMILSGAATLLVLFLVVIIIVWCHSKPRRRASVSKMDQEAIYESDVIYKKRNVRHMSQNSGGGGGVAEQKTFKNGGITTDSSFTFVKVGEGLRVRDASQSQEEYLDKLQDIVHMTDNEWNLKICGGTWTPGEKDSKEALIAVEGEGATTPDNTCKTATAQSSKSCTTPSTMRSLLSNDTGNNTT